jgi:hypothetical protein
MAKGGEMKRRNIIVLLALFCVLPAIFFWGCGGSGPGSPGSSGSADTGIAVSVSGVTHSDPSGDQGDIWEVDLFMQQCTATTVEKWGNDYAHVTFHGEALNPTVVSTNQLFVTNYKVTFTKTNPSLPTIEQMSFGSQSGISVLPGQDTIGDFLIMDTGRKIQIQDDIGYPPGGGGTNPVFTPLLYNMKIEMWGQDKYGNSVVFPPIIRVIDISNWNHC